MNKPPRVQFGHRQTVFPNPAAVLSTRSSRIWAIHRRRPRRRRMPRRRAPHSHWPIPSPCSIKPTSRFSSWMSYSQRSSVVIVWVVYWPALRACSCQAPWSPRICSSATIRSSTRTRCPQVCPTRPRLCFRAVNMPCSTRWTPNSTTCRLH